MNNQDAPDWLAHADSSLLPPGLILQDRYQITRSLGSGGFSQVFEIVDRSIPKVLKVLAPHAFKYVQAQQQAIAFLQREAEFLSQFRHPGIPIVEPESYFVWNDQNHSPFHCLVMEKVTGINLQDWISKNQDNLLSQKLASAWLRQLIDILTYLHEHQFFHRDIKPSNIMLRPDGQLVLIDFGGVREITETYLRKQQLQATGTALVSAGYTPPEQIEGHAVPQSDFFALGRTFVALFTGTDPLMLPKDPQTGQVLWRNRAVQVSPPLADLIDYLMALLPRQRPQDCASLHQVFNQVSWRLTLQQRLPFLRYLPQWNDLVFRHRLRSPQFRLALLKVGISGFLLSSSVGVWTNRVDLSDYLNEQGTNFYEQKNEQNAKWLYQLALLLHPDNREANYNLGAIYESHEQIAQARTAYGKAAELEEIRAFNNLARLRILDRKYIQAVELLKKGLGFAKSQEHELDSVTLQNNRYALFKNLGWAYLEQGQYDSAYAELGKAVLLKPKQAAAQCLMAQVLTTQAKTAQALSHWQNCSTGEDQRLPEELSWKKLARSYTIPQQ